MKKVSRPLLVLPFIMASIAQEGRSSDFTVASRLANETVRQKVERGNQSVVAGRGADQRVCRNRSTHHLAEFVSPTLDVPDSARTLPQADETQSGSRSVPLRMADRLIGRIGLRLPDAMSAQEPARAVSLSRKARRDRHHSWLQNAISLMDSGMDFRSWRSRMPRGICNLWP